MKSCTYVLIIFLCAPMIGSCFLYKTPEIDITSEEIVLELYKDHAHISITLTFFNNENYSYTGEIGFPGQNYPAYSLLTGIIPYNTIDLFTVQSDGIDISYVMEEAAYPDPLLSEEYTSEWFYYNDTFQPFAFHTMEISYDVETTFSAIPVYSDIYNRICSYIIHTALSWGSTIPSLYITIENKEPEEISAITFHLKNNYQVDTQQTTFLFTFTDFVPDEDIFVFYNTQDG